MCFVIKAYYYNEVHTYELTCDAVKEVIGSQIRAFAFHTACRKKDGKDRETDFQLLLLAVVPNERWNSFNYEMESEKAGKKPHDELEIIRNSVFF